MILYHLTCAFHNYTSVMRDCESVSTHGRSRLRSWLNVAAPFNRSLTQDSHLSGMHIVASRGGKGTHFRDKRESGRREGKEDIELEHRCIISRFKNKPSSKRGAPAGELQGRILMCKQTSVRTGTGRRFHPRIRFQLNISSELYSELKLLCMFCVSSFPWARLGVLGVC